MLTVITFRARISHNIEPIQSHVAKTPIAFEARSFCASCQARLFGVADEESRAIFGVLIDQARELLGRFEQVRRSSNRTALWEPTELASPASPLPQNHG